MLGNSAETKLQLYLVDFGLAREDFLDPPKQPLTNVSFRGTAAYASLRSLKNIEQGWRDDLEGAFWVMIDLLLGGVPWRKIAVGKSKERDQKIREGKTQIFDALRDVNGGKVTLRPSFPYDSVYCGPYAPGSYIPISTVGLSGVDLLESMPTQMVKLLTNISHLQFNTKPDYEFMRNCFLQLEVQGDTEGFRRKFGAVTRYEAIAKEILGVDWNERSWNTITTDETPKQPVKRKRAREPEVVEEPPAPSPSPHLHAVLNNAFTPLQPRKLAAADSPGYDPPPSIGRTPPPPLSMPPQGGATSSSGAELGGTAGRTSSTKNAGTMGSMNNNGGGTAGTTVAGLTVGQSTTAGIFWGSFLQDHVPPRPPDAAALLQTQQEPALKRVRKDTPLPTSAKMGGILKRTKKAEK